jgi:ATP-dependent DNA helicase PIF1
VVHSKVLRENPTLEIIFGSDIFNKAFIILEDKCVAMINTATRSACTSMRPTRCTLHRLRTRKILQRRRAKCIVAGKKPLLNQDQKKAHQIIMDQVAKQGGIIFLDASGGTRKTFLTNLIFAKIRAQGEAALAITSSGIAATLMEGGRTAHSTLKLPFDIARQENPTCNISIASGRAQVLRTCKLIVWDECSMAHKNALKALDVILRDLR